MEINFNLGDRILIRYLKYYGDKLFSEVCDFLVNASADNRYDPDNVF